MRENVEVSILIVHTFESAQLRQTLRAIRRAAPTISTEIIVIDNNPAGGFGKELQANFSEVHYIPLAKNKGFGGGMNEGIRVAKGRYILVFNPDIHIASQSLEKMVSYMDQHQEIGILGPQLKNPDGTLQYSCYRIPTGMIPLYRRTPLGKLPFGKKAVDQYLMKDVNHERIMNVDSLIGAALFIRKTALEKVGYFDERYFMYFEDNDLCRRFWESGFKVVYYPEVTLMHYHNRASAKGHLLTQVFNRFTWIHTASFVKYYFKYRRAINPREEYEKNHA